MVYSGARIEGISPNVADYSTANPNSGHIMEAVISITEMDGRLFDSIIECDLLEASGVIQEGAMDVLKNIGNKAVQMIEKAIQWVKDHIAKFINNIKSFVRGEKKMEEKYKKALKMENMKDFTGIPGKFAFPKEVIMSTDLKSVVDIQADLDNFTMEIGSQSTKDEVDRVYDSIRSNLVTKYKGTDTSDEASPEKRLMKDKFEPEVENWKPTSDQQLQKALSFASRGTEYVSSIKKYGDFVIAYLQKARKQVQKEMKSMGGGRSTSDATYVMKRIYDVHSVAIKSYSKVLNIYTNVAAKQMAAYRKVVKVCGAYAIRRSGGSSDTKKEDTKATKTEEKNELAVQGEATSFIIAEASDLYVAELFGF